MLAIFEKEMKSYFHSILAYLFLALFWAAAAIYFTVYCLSYGLMDFGGYVFGSIPLLFLVIVPILTMRLMADEKKQKTDQLLITSPLRISEVILGKYLAVLTLFGIGVLGVLGYAFLLSFYGELNWTTTLTAGLGYYLVGAAFLAVGTFFSCCTESQAAAAVLTVATVLACYLLPNLAGFHEGFAKVVSWLSPLDRFDHFINGILDVSSIIYYLSLVGLFLFFSVQNVEKRRWN